jgi:hypothetical protein
MFLVKKSDYPSKVTILMGSHKLYNSLFKTFSELSRNPGHLCPAKIIG